MKKHISFIIIFIVLLLSFTGCKSGSSTEIFYAMDTVMTVTVYGSGAKKASKAAYNEVLRLEKLLSVTDEGSEIYALNHRTASDVSAETAALIEKALEISRETGGAFDITFYPVSLLWGFITKDYKVPSAEEISKTLIHCGSENVSISGTHINLPEGFMLDLGGIAKGYAAEKVKEKLVGMGIKSAIISLGGNVQTIGKKPGGDKWKIGIADPFGNESSESIYAEDSAVVTSGGYQRNFTHEGKTYHHIIDPKTGYPAESGIASVTVICESGTEADALSTAFFVMGKDKTEQFCSNHEGISAVIIMQNGEVINVK